MEKLTQEESQYNLDIFPAERAFSTVLLLPGIPNFWIDDKNWLIKFFTTRNTNFLYLDDNTYGEKLEDNSKEVISLIKKNNIQKIDANLPIFIVGLSYGGGVSMKLSNNKDIEHIFALSPLTQDTAGNINWKKILDYIYEIYVTKLGLSTEQIKKDIINLVTIENINLEKVSIFGVKQDKAIQLPNTYKATLFKEEELWISHFGLSKTWWLTESNKEKLFGTILQYNLARKVEYDFIKECLEVFGNDNISGIMTHGANAFNTRNDKTSDFDFILVINKLKKWSLQSINLIIKRLKNKHKNIDLDISVFCKETIEKLGFDYVMTSSHSPVYSIVFGYAKILYWENIFKKSIKYFPDLQIRKAFILEIWKYVDRFNRLYLQNKIDKRNLKKYISRIIMCYLIGNKKLWIKNSNHFTTKHAVQALSKYFYDFEYTNLFIKILSEDNIEESYIGEWIDGLNLFLQKYGKLDSFWNFNVWRFKNKLRKSLKLIWYKNSIHFSPNFQKPKDIIWISCLWFSKLNCLDTNVVLTEEQISKNMIMGLVSSKIRKLIEELYWISVPIWFKIGDYGISLKWDIKTNIVYMKRWQSYLEKELVNFLSGDATIWRLSKDFRDKWENVIIEYKEPIVDYNKFKKLLTNSKYNLSDKFIESYLKKYFNDDIFDSMLKIIYSSVKEHLELAYKIATKRDNKIILFVGNAEKILLMAKVLESMEQNTNILIWLSPEKNKKL